MIHARERVPNMTLLRTVILLGVIWVLAISALHARMNLNAKMPWEALPAGASTEKKFRVGFIPVTCHLTCPVTDFINKSIEGEGFYDPLKFQGFPELKEAFLAGYMPATFILAPLAMKLREEGVPLKIVYLGHRDGTAMMVHKDSSIFRIEDLKGKTIAIPNRFSNQYLLIFKALRERGISIKEVNIVEMPPPDMPAALYSKAVDAVTSGEPFMAQTELDGYGRILYLTKDVWPNFISCVLAVKEDAIKNDRAMVQRLVDGISKSGKWLEGGMDHRLQAAGFVARQYYHQHPRLLRYVLSKPPDRVKYTNLTLRKKDFDEIQGLARDAGTLKWVMPFEEYCDTSFVPDDSVVVPYDFSKPDEALETAP